MRFLLIEDNLKLAGAIEERLRLDGHAVDHTQRRLKWRGRAWMWPTYDLILLDIMLPDGDGRTFLQSHRRAEKRTPVIVITARSAVSDRVSLLDLGADDYITKPFDFSELEARCRAVSCAARAGLLTTARNLKRLYWIQPPVSCILKVKLSALRNRELRLLEVFFAAPGQIFSKNHLMDRSVFPVR